MRPLPAGSPWIAAAVLVAVAVPMTLIWRAQPAPPTVVTRGETVAPTPIPSEVASARALFLDPLDPANAPAAEDAPKLIGIAGRLPDHAIAMVRAADGTSKVLSPGQSFEGWTLESLSPDAALFSRGSRKVRSFLAAPEATPEPEVSAEESEGW